ncbi:MAG: response regulator [Caldilineaceae bacterium]
MPPLVLRQTLLTLPLQLLMPVVAHQTLTLCLTEAQGTVILAIALPASTDSMPEGDHWQQAHQVAVQLLTPFHGTIRVQNQTSPCQIELTLPKVAGIPILVVDDNPDTCQLLQRYAAHSRYQVIPVTDARQTLALAQQHAARALVLDVMMPDLDGWDLLAQLRHHPATHKLPIAVCTVLPQQELARLLGATHFLQKPISQESFLTALTALAAATAITPD